MKPILAALLLAGCGCSAAAAVIKASTTGCTSPADAASLTGSGRKAAGQAAGALVASRACLPFAKGITVDVDETKAPLSCVRLTGDLSCYWIATALVDEHPGEKGSGTGKHGGGAGRRR